jgi:uncharacterized protein
LKEQLQLLERLQQIDELITRDEKDLARLPAEVQEIARNLVTLRRELSESKDRLATSEKELRKKEQDLSVEQEKLKRSEKRLHSIKNQKELNALSREIKLGKKVAGEIEDMIFNLMSEVEHLKKSVDKKELEYTDLEAGLLTKKAEADTITSEAGRHLSVLKEDREQIAQNVERDILKRYNTVRKARGNAVVEVSNGSCTGCHITLPPQLNIRVLKREEFISCPNCHRILFVRPEKIPGNNHAEE